MTVLFSIREKKLPCLGYSFCFFPLEIVWVWFR